MASPSFRTPPRPQEPKEDGEVGEKIGDLLQRHGQELKGELGRMVKELDDNVGVFSPATMKMVGRMLSAALSPMPHKASPEHRRRTLWRRWRRSPPSTCRCAAGRRARPRRCRRKSIDKPRRL